MAEEMQIDIQTMKSDEPVTHKILNDYLFSFYKNVYRDELQALAVDIDTQLNIMQRNIYETRNQLNDIAQEARQAQLESSRLQSIAGKWPYGGAEIDSSTRASFIYEVLAKSDTVKQIMYADGLGDGWTHPHITRQALVVTPVTVFFAGKWSPVTILTWRSFQLRQAWQKMWRERGPDFKYYNKNYPIRMTPASPLFSRKKECIIRAIMGAVAKHPDLVGHEIVPLWHSLVVMEPQHTRSFDELAEAWCRVWFEQDNSGRIICKVEMTIECREVMMTIDPKTGNSLFHIAFHEQIFGRQVEFDDAERAAHARHTRRGQC